jgi:hypothetical protein
MASSTSEPDALAIAEAAHAAVQANAARGRQLAEAALRLARQRSEPEAEVAALHALGFAQYELGDLNAIATLRRAVRIADRHRLARRAALARRPLSMYLAYRGAIQEAWRELEAASEALDERELARTQVFSVALTNIAGRSLGSFTASDRALALLRRDGDRIWEARLLRNRGMLLAERGDPVAAEADLRGARDLYMALGATDAAAGAELQLARVTLARGDLPACLAQLDLISTEAVSPRDRAELELLRASALSAARLDGEAIQAITITQEILERAGSDDQELRLELPRLMLLAGDPRQAHALARRAQRSFAAGRRATYAARARGLALAAATRDGTVRSGDVRAGQRAAATLLAAGWLTESHRVRLAVARAAIALGSVRTARRELAACASLLARGAIGDRIEAWHVEALIRLAEGNPGGSQAAARAGLRVLEEHRAALGAADLRATASSIGSELAALGLRIALADPRPGPAFAWAETLRASSLRLAPVTPPDNPELGASLTELRQLTSEIARAEQGGRSTRGLLGQQARVETRVRRLSRHAPGEERPSRASPSRRQLASALGSRVLVEYVESDGELTALTLADGRLRRHALGAAAAIAEQLEWLRFGLARLAQLRRDAAQHGALVAGAASSAAALERVLLEPLRDVAGRRDPSRELVLVPTGALHSLPWAMLPALRGRAVSVAPSAAVWWALQMRPRTRTRRRRVVAAAGPRLRHARAEALAVAACHTGATVLTGRDAGVAATLRALDGAAIAHLACHGRVRTDSPLFSSLELADGQLNAYELARLRRAPELIVLSACDLAVSDARAGDELLGFAGALLDMGTRTIVASVVPVPDAAARRVMPALHRELAAGTPAAAALARAQAALPARDAALAGFVCLGAQ